MLSIVESYFRIQKGLDPDVVCFLFARPEENPKIMAYELSAGDVKANYIVEFNENNCVCREVTDEKELEHLKNFTPEETEEVETL